MFRSFFTSISFFLIFSQSFAQEGSSYIDVSLEGYWEGALIRTSNSIQLVAVDFEMQGDSTLAYFKVKEWPFSPDRISKVDSEGITHRFDSPYGKVTAVMDTSYMELLGTVDNAIPPISIHLKKMARPAVPAVAEREISIKRKGANISGTLCLPSVYARPLPLAILVHGRGCSPRSYLLEKARKLAEYGIATFAYDKRGSEPSGFPCGECTHELIVEDLLEVTDMLADRPEIDREKIGYLSNSAGGWIVPDAADRSEIPIAFMITIVGPSTSVLGQQLDGVRAFGEKDGYTPEAIEEAVEYTYLTFSDTNSVATFNRMQELLKSARKKGWVDWLADTDIPPSADEIKNLWVQRFDFDPGPALARFEGDFLSLLGEDDPIVPYQEQINRFSEVFKNKENYRIHVIKSAGHGLGHGSEVRSLGFQSNLRTTPYYYKYYRNGYGTLQYIVDFLRDFEYIE